jgi:hypothetical protein
MPYGMTKLSIDTGDGAACDFRVRIHRCLDVVFSLTARTAEFGLAITRRIANNFLGVAGNYWNLRIVTFEDTGYTYW